MYVRCSLQGYGLSFSTKIMKISFHRDQSGLDYLFAGKIWDLQVILRTVGAGMVLCEIDVVFTGGFFSFPEC